MFVAPSSSLAPHGTHGRQGRCAHVYMHTHTHRHTIIYSHTHRHTQSYTLSHIQSHRDTFSYTQRHVGTYSYIHTVTQTHTEAHMGSHSAYSHICRHTQPSRAWTEAGMESGWPPCIGPSQRVPCRTRSGVSTGARRPTTVSRSNPSE